MTTRAQVGTQMARLRDAYPNLFTESPEQWTGRVAAYHGKLKRFDLDVVTAACERVIDKYPDRFPTAGQLTSVCIAVADEWKAEARERAEMAERKREDAENRAAVMEKREAVIPDSRQDQDRWIAEGKNPFDRQARRWEVESKNLGLEPNQATPSEIGKRRMAELMKLVAEEGGTVPIPGGSKPRERGDVPPGFFYDGSAPSSYQDEIDQASKPEPGWDG